MSNWDETIQVELTEKDKDDIAEARMHLDRKVSRALNKADLTEEDMRKLLRENVDLYLEFMEKLLKG